jgi:hypothetical protein
MLFCWEIRGLFFEKLWGKEKFVGRRWESGTHEAAAEWGGWRLSYHFS